MAEHPKIPATSNARVVVGNSAPQAKPVPDWNPIRRLMDAADPVRRSKHKIVSHRRGVWAINFGPDDDPLARLDWQRARQTVLTSTDVAAILGLDLLPSGEPRKSRFQVWTDKVKPLTDAELVARDAEFAEIEHVRWGNLLEPALAAELASRLGRTLIDHGRYTLFVNENLPVPTAVSIDREISAHLRPVDPQRLPGVMCLPCEWARPGHGALAAFEDKLAARALAYHSCPGLAELKTVGAFADPAAEWQDPNGGPVRHQIQLQTALCVTGLSWGVLAGLHGYPAFHMAAPPESPALEHARDDEFIKWMLGQLEIFWEYVLAKEPPPIDGSEATAKALSRFYNHGNGGETALRAEVGVWVQELAKHKEAEKYAQVQARECRNRILAAMGEASIGTIAGLEGGIRLSDIKESTWTTTRRAHRRLKAFGALAKHEFDGD